MTLKHWLAGTAGALALGTLSAAVQAAPLGIAPDDLKVTAEKNSALQDVVWLRRCWWHNRHRHCRRVWRDGGYYYDPYPYDGGFFFGPSIGFSFGGGRHHGHHFSGHHRRR
jgi:hypothetical protein